MTARFRRCLTMSIFVIATATLCAGAEPRRSTLRLVNAEEPLRPNLELGAAQGAAPTDVLTSDALGADVVPTPVPPPVPEQLGNELLQPAPNPYQASAPQASYAPEPPADYFEPHPSAPLRRHLSPRRVVDHIQNRPRQPQLQQESWLNRPWGASFFIGGMFFDHPLPTVRGDSGFMYGGRLSWDFAPKWGTELRLGAANPGVTDKTPAGLVLPQANIFFWDANWLYYPTGDTRWRPYVTAGFGLFEAMYYDATQKQFNDTAFSLPFGVGFKYRHSTRITMRFDIQDVFVFSTGPQDSMNNLTISAGFEGRFGGGSRKNYWPWNPGSDWR